MVQGIERFTAKLEVTLLPQVKLLQQRGAEFIDAVGAHVGKGAREGADVILQRIRGPGIESTHVEGVPVRITRVRIEFAAIVNIVAVVVRAAVDPDYGAADLVRVRGSELPSTHGQIERAGMHVKVPAPAERQFVNDIGSDSPWTEEWGDAALRRGIGVVKPRGLVDRLRLHEIEVHLHAAREASLQPQVKALEEGTAHIVVLFDHAARSAAAI